MDVTMKVAIGGLNNTKGPNPLIQRYQILAIPNTLIAHDTVFKDLRFFDVDQAHLIP